MRALSQGVAKTRGISLVFEELPTALSERLFVGDVRRLQQCLNNGVSNALKFSDAGGTVHVRAELPAAPPAQSEAATRPSSRAIAEPVGAAQALGGRLSHHARRLMPALSDAARTASVSDAGTDGALIASPAWGALEPAKVAPAPAEEGRRTPLRVSVRDWGVGLSREDLEQLREGAAFSQVGRGKEQGSSGTGLGLTIARQILAMHGSTLGIESGGHGKGTRYTMELLLPEPPAGDGASHAHDARHDARDCLSVNDSAGARGEGGVPALTPRSARHDSAPTLGLSSPVLAQSGRGAQPLRVLYADDDEFLQLTVPLRVFAPLGVPYDTAENGALAVELVTRAGAMHYDLVVMDNQVRRGEGGGRKGGGWGGGGGGSAGEAPPPLWAFFLMAAPRPQINCALARAASRPPTHPRADARHERKRRDARAALAWLSRHHRRDDGRPGRQRRAQQL